MKGQYTMENVTILTHPLIQHKISILRNKKTGTNEFRSLIEEIAMLMGFEALRDLPLTDVEVETPIETCMTPMIAGKKMAVVPILRAGLGMVNGILALVPSAKVGHIGLYRDEETHEPHEYYCKLPDPIDQRTIVVTDPMLATGGSAVSAIDFIKQHKDEPFFMYFATNDVHVPRFPHDRFRGKNPMGVRGDAIVQFDWSVGQIMETLDKLGLAENTFIILSSDNGPVVDDGYDDTIHNRHIVSVTRFLIIEQLGMISTGRLTRKILFITNLYRSRRIIICHFTIFYEYTRNTVGCCCHDIMIIKP